MALIYSTSIAHGLRAGATNAVVFTVPATQTLVIRSVTLYCYAGGAASAGVTHSDGARVCTSDVAGATGGDLFDMRHVFEAGEPVYVFTTTADWTYAISGYLLNN